MRRAALASILYLLLPAASAPAQPTATVHRVPLEPTIRVVPASAGKTVVERYHAPRSGALPAGEPLVAIARLRPVNSPDTVTVTRVRRRGRRLVVDVETRRYTGRLSANIVTTPLIELALGDLGRGRHGIAVRETVYDFDDLDHPERGKNRRKGQHTTLSFEVR